MVRILSSSALQAAPFPLGTLSLLPCHFFLVKNFVASLPRGIRTPNYLLRRQEPYPVRRWRECRNTRRHTGTERYFVWWVGLVIIPAHIFNTPHYSWVAKLFHFTATHKTSEEETRVELARGFSPRRFSKPFPYH